MVHNEIKVPTYNISCRSNGLRLFSKLFKNELYKDLVHLLFPDTQCTFSSSKYIFLLSYLFLALNCVMHGAFSFLKDQYISNFFCREKLLFPRRILVVRSACADNYAPNVHGFRSSNSRARYGSSKDIENFQFNSFVFIFINIKVVNCFFFLIIFVYLII